MGFAQSAVQSLYRKAAADPHGRSSNRAIRRNSRRSRVYNSLQIVKLSAIYKVSTNPSDGGQSPFHGLWGFASVSASPFQMSAAFLPLLAYAGLHFTALEARSADPTRAKPGLRPPTASQRQKCSPRAAKPRRPLRGRHAGRLCLPAARSFAPRIGLRPIVAPPWQTPVSLLCSLTRCTPYGASGLRPCLPPRHFHPTPPPRFGYYHDSNFCADMYTVFDSINLLNSLQDTSIYIKKGR